MRGLPAEGGGWAVFPTHTILRFRTRGELVLNIQRATPYANVLFYTLGLYGVSAFLELWVVILIGGSLHFGFIDFLIFKFYTIFFLNIIINFSKISLVAGETSTAG